MPGLACEDGVKWTLTYDNDWAEKQGSPAGKMG
jgi:hypothetical protein